MNHALEYFALARQPITRTVYLVAGWVCVALGVIGAFLPVMPTTVFMIAALACFAKGSPETARRLLDHPRFGPSLRAWKSEGAISARSKTVAVTAMAASWGIVAYTQEGWIVPTVVGAILIAVATYVLTRPLPSRD
jgi:uncharacterized membrane protein YbaN (DUF454 family)